MIDTFKESRLFLFEDNFKIRYECNASYIDYCKYCKTEIYKVFSNKTFK
ncbi:MAG: hypothetical protein Ta2E_12930 [Mycoplasmoidaceae bacterium]|nr:MAG: hypothetical protein Ta2E_12930 [Mycoplasmoidaceae bacterium]